MATPDQILPSLAARLKALEDRINYVDQRSQLARAVWLDYAQGSATNVATSIAPTVMHTVTKSCPVGYDRVHIVVWATAMAVNSTATAAYMYVQANIAGYDMGELYTPPIPAGAQGSAASAPHITWTGITAGQALAVSVKVRTPGGVWAAHANNQFGIGATYIWFR